MKRYILSTEPIIREFKNFERLFEFRRDGIRGLVRDSIVGTHNFTYPRTFSAMEELIQKVLKEFEASIQYQEIQHNYPDPMPSVTIEYVMETIQHTVNALVKNIFMDHPYDISTDHVDWVGDDIVIVVRFLQWNPHAGKNHTRM